MAGGLPPSWSAVAKRVARQWGVISRAQLRAAGVAPATVDYWVRAGRLRVVYRSAYAVGGTVLRVEGHRLAAVLACGPGAVLSHRSAAAHWGLLATDQERTDVTAPRSREGLPGIRLHTSRSLGAQDTTSHEGIPITTVHRTLLDRIPAAPGRAAPAASVLVWCRRTTLRQHDAGTGVTFGARSPTIDHCPG